MMKKLFLILVLCAISFTATAQKRMALIKAMPETVIAVDATPKVINGSFVFITSQNNVSTFEITEPFEVNPRVGEVQKDVQYYFILSVQSCGECVSRPAKVLGYATSRRQAIKDINDLNDQFLINSKE